MKKSDGIDEFVAFLEGVEEEASNADPFFNAHMPRYFALAQRVAVQTLLAHRPDELDPAAWKENVSDFADMLFSRTFHQGMEIGFQQRTEFDREAARNRGQNLGNFTPITYDDVYAWVEAGAGEGGKDFTKTEAARDRSIEQVSYDVFTAIRQHRLGVATDKDYTRITQRLEDWVNSRVLKGDIDELLKLILDAWTGALFPVLSRDFEEWITYDILR